MADSHGVGRAVPRQNRRGSAVIHALRRPVGLVGLASATLLVVAALAAPLAPHDATAQDYDHVLEAPGGSFWLGTDNLGRDVFSRVIKGGQISLTMGLAVGLIALLIGVPLGLAGGYRGGWLDRILTGFMDTLMAFPSLLLAIAIAAVLGQSLMSAISAIAVVELPRFQRVARAQVLTVRKLEFIEAARSIGSPHMRIVLRHVLPNIAAPIVVQFSLSVSFAILAEGALSFLGLSVPPPAPAWGFMLNVGRGYLEQAPWVAIFPGLAIVIAVLGFNLLGDALRDAVDPRLRQL